MLSICTRKLALLILAIGTVSWYGTATGFAQFAGAGGADGPSSLVILIAVTASALVQSLMAVFLTISLGAYIVHLRTRALYFFGYAIMTAISVALAVAFWANFMSLPEAEFQSVFEANSEKAEEVANASLVTLTHLYDNVASLQAQAAENIDHEAVTGLGDRHAHWTQLNSGLNFALTELAALKADLEAGISAAGKATTLDELQQALSVPMEAIVATNVPSALDSLVDRAIEREATLADGGGHRQRWERFLPLLEALEVELSVFKPDSLPSLQDSDVGKSHGDKAYALTVIQNFLTGAPLTQQEKIALALAIVTDLIFAILLILRTESRRPDQAPDLIHHYTPTVESLNARLKRNDFENGISSVVSTLQGSGKGLLGFDRLFGLVVSLPDASSKSQLSQTIAFLKSDGMALDVSGLATLFSSINSGSTIRKREAMRVEKRRGLTVLIPPAQWRLINRLKQVEDLMPTPEDKGTLAHFVQQQRRKKPRIYTAQKVNTLNKYFSSAMEASLDELVPARIERIMDAYKSDTRARRLTRNTREKHEAIFREIIDAVRNEGLLPNAKLRVAG